MNSFEVQNLTFPFLSYCKLYGWVLILGVFRGTIVRTLCLEDNLFYKKDHIFNTDISYLI